MKIAAVAIVRDVADVIALSLLHHFHSGIDVMYIVDHASADGTAAILARASRRFPIRWIRHEGAFVQRELTTDLARLAYREGAEWIVPIDGDEFLWAEGGSVRNILSETDGGALECEVVNFVQRREQIEKSADALLTMTRRIAEPLGAEIDAHTLVASHRASFVEVAFPRKWICRAGEAIDILPGAHVVTGVRGAYIRSDAIKILHAPLRAKSVFATRVEHGERLVAVETDPEIGWQARWWRNAAAEGMLDREWAANSYAGDALELDGELRPLAIDLRLRDALVKWIDDDLVVSRPDMERSFDIGSGRVATVSRRSKAMDVELRELVRAAELRGTQQRLRSAVEAVAARDAIIADLEATLARIARSVPGRIYRRLTASKALRALVRLVTGLR